jgi:hypothetical protein
LIVTAVSSAGIGSSALSTPTVGPVVSSESNVSPPPPDGHDASGRGRHARDVVLGSDIERGVGIAITDADDIERHL